MALMSSPEKSRNSAEPRWRTERTPGRKTVGPRIVAISRKLGREPMPWQHDFLMVVGEMVRDDETGFWVPAYPEAFATVMRQQGKTTIAESWMWDRMIAWESFDDKAQAVVWTAQNGAEARKKFRNEVLPAWRNTPMWKHVDKPRLMAEDTGLSMKNGSNLTISNTSASAGHGFVVDAALLDEIFADQDNRREQALVPSMATRHDRQKLVISTAGDDSSVLYNRKQQAGRAAVDEGRDTGIAYVEYSADPSDPDYDPQSPSTWRKCMPALGYTITERMVRQAFDEMLADPESGGVAEFERAWLNVPNKGTRDRAIPEALWQAVVRPDVTVSGGQALAVDAHADRSSSSIVLADNQHRAKLVAYQQGTAWLLPMLVEHAKRLRVPVAVDMRGPIPHLAEDLESAGVEVVKFGTSDVVRACSRFWELLADGKLTVKDAPPLVAAVESAAKRPVGDAWLWSRPASVDASPLVALTLAFDVAAGRGEWKGPPALWA